MSVGKLTPPFVHNEVTDAEVIFPPPPPAVGKAALHGHEHRRAMPAPHQLQHSREQALHLPWKSTAKLALTVAAHKPALKARVRGYLAPLLVSHEVACLQGNAFPAPLPPVVTES